MIAYIYSRPLWIIICIIFIMPLLRGIITIPKLPNNLLLILCTVVILYVTLLRTPDNEREVILCPFYSFSMVKIQPEIYRELIMNVLLFVPLGLFLPYLFSKKNILFAILFAMLLSVMIESLQYIFFLGLTEVDDVIFNTIGTIIGSLSFLISYLKKKIVRITNK